MVRRWTFNDPATGDAWTFEANPKESTSPPLQRTLNYEKTTAPDGQKMFFQGRDTPPQIEFSGNLRTESMLGELLNWYSKRRQVQLTDDLGRNWWVYVTSFAPKRTRRASARHLHAFDCKVTILDWPPPPGARRLDDGYVVDSSYLIDSGVPTIPQIPSVRGDSYGVAFGQISVVDADVVADFDSASQAAKWARIVVDWSLVEASQGAFDWTTLDAVVSLAGTRGMNFIFVIGYTPPWANGGFVDRYYYPDLTNHSESWENFCAVAAQRYRPGATTVPAASKVCWEVWNEPNVPEFGKNQSTGSADPSVYVTLYALARSAIRTVDPVATIITGGVGPSTTNALLGGNVYRHAYDATAPQRYSPVDWYLDVFGVYSPGGGRYNGIDPLQGAVPINVRFDGIGLHGYWPGDAGPLWNYPGSPKPTSDNWNTFVLVGTIAGIGLSTGGQLEQCKVWVTECGAETVPYWTDGTFYDVGDVVYYGQGGPNTDGKRWDRTNRYYCMAPHVADPTLAPPIAPPTLWVSHANGDRSYGATYGYLLEEEDEAGYYLREALGVWFGDTADATGSNIAQLTAVICVFTERDGITTLDPKFGLVDADGHQKGSSSGANGAYQALVTTGVLADNRP